MQPVEHFIITYEVAEKAGALPLLNKGIREVLRRRQEKLLEEQSQKQQKLTAVGD